MIGVIGIDHNRASISERASFALTVGEGAMLIGDWQACGLLAGAVVLSTCNRVEIYYEVVDDISAEEAEQRLAMALLQNLELSPRLSERLLMLKGEEAVRHLFRLGAGLESVVLGETQILGQLKEAYRIASTTEMCTPVLSRLFHRAFEVAKLIRSKHFAEAMPRSAGSAAVEAVLSAQAELLTRPTLIVGAGLMAETIYNSLVALGATEIRVYNRTRERAERFAKAHPRASCYCEGELPRALEGIESLYVATSAPRPIILEEHLQNSPCRHVVDLAVPRNVAEAVDNLPSMKLWDIDALSGGGIGLSPEAMASIDAVIEEHITLFERWLGGAQLRETISALQRATSSLVERELSALPSSLSEQERALIARWDEHLRITISTAFISALRVVSEDGKLTRPVDAVDRLCKQIMSTFIEDKP